MCTAYKLFSNQIQDNYAPIIKTVSVGSINISCGQSRDFCNIEKFLIAVKRQY